MVGREDLRHAISLNSMMFNLARVIGPPVAGILIALVGIGICFSLDALSYMAVIICLTMMLFQPRPVRKPCRSAQGHRQGFVYVWRDAGTAPFHVPDRFLLGLRRVLYPAIARFRPRCAAPGQRRPGLSIRRGRGGRVDGRLCPGAGAGPASAGHAGGGGAQLRPGADRLFPVAYLLAVFPAADALLPSA